MPDPTPSDVLTLNPDEENEVIARPIVHPEVTIGLVEEIATEISDLIHELIEEFRD